MGRIQSRLGPNAPCLPATAHSTWEAGALHGHAMGGSGGTGTCCPDPNRPLGTHGSCLGADLKPEDGEGSVAVLACNLVVALLLGRMELPAATQLSTAARSNVLTMSPWPGGSKLPQVSPQTRTGAQNSDTPSPPPSFSSVPSRLCWLRPREQKEHSGQPCVVE